MQTQQRKEEKSTWKLKLWANAKKNRSKNKRMVTKKDCVFLSISTDNESHTQISLSDINIYDYNFVRSKGRPNHISILHISLSKYTLSKRRESGGGRACATQADKARYGELANIKFVIARLFAELTLVAPPFSLRRHSFMHSPRAHSLSVVRHRDTETETERPRKLAYGNGNDDDDDDDDGDDDEKSLTEQRLPFT